MQHVPCEHLWGTLCDRFVTHLAGGKAASRVGTKIVLDHVRVYICMYVCLNYACVLWISSPLVVYDAIDNASSSRAHED